MRAICLAALLLAGCANSAVAGSSPPSSQDDPLSQARAGGALAVYDALEQMIDEGKASESDRERAHVFVEATADDGSAGYAFARAGIAGRLAEGRGLKALGRIKEAAKYGALSVERDPTFRDGLNRQVLATIHVLAGQHIEGGDSEEGLETLEALVAEHPNHAAHRLRLGQAYIELGDPEPGVAHLCFASAHEGELRPHERKLLGDLLGSIERTCPAGAT